MPAHFDDVEMTMLMAMANEKARELEFENSRLHAQIEDLRETVKIYKQLVKDSNK